MTQTAHILAGDCTATFEGSRERTQRGYVVVVVKPDRTVLVHDADGYQPVAWLTRPDDLIVETSSGDEGGDGAGTATDSTDGDQADGEPRFTVSARADEQVLTVVSHTVTADVTVPVTQAGVPVGTHPETGGPLVRSGGAVVALDADERYALPSGAEILDEPCDDCGLPRMRVERGDVFELCIDYACESLLDAIEARFDRAWHCPDCGSPLRIFRMRGGAILAGCTAYPECDTAFTIPTGVIADECPCGLPVFETASGRRCLDSTCDRYLAGDGDGSPPPRRPTTSAGTGPVGEGG